MRHIHRCSKLFTPQVRDEIGTWNFHHIYSKIWGIKWFNNTCGSPVSLQNVLKYYENTWKSWKMIFPYTLTWWYNKCVLNNVLHRRSYLLAPLYTLGMVSYLPLTVTMGLTCTVCLQKPIQSCVTLKYLSRSLQVITYLPLPIQSTLKADSSYWIKKWFHLG